MRWRKTGYSELKEAVLTFLVAFVGLSVVVSIIVGGLSVVAGYKPSIMLVSSLLIIMSFIITLFRRKLLGITISALIKIFRIPLNESEKENLDNIDAIEGDPFLREYKIDSGDVFIVWSFFDRVKNLVAPNAGNLTLILFDSKFMFPAAIYPEDNAVLDDSVLETLDENDMFFNDLMFPLVIKDKNGIKLIIDLKLFNIILNSIVEDKETMKDKLYIDNKKLLKIIYYTAKKIYKEANKEAPEELAIYSAYKTLRKLQLEGILEIKPDIADVILPERPDLRTALLDQIEEEESTESKTTPEGNTFKPGRQ